MPDRPIHSLRIAAQGIDGEGDESERSVHQFLQRGLGRAPGASTAAPSAESPRHGGDLAAARAAFPEAPEPWIDLSTGINPDAYPLPQIGTQAWARLPQADDLHALRAAAARRYGARGAEMLAAAPGTQALIGLIPRLVPPARVAVLGPTYAEHAAAWRRAGHEVREVRALAEAAGAHVVVLVNPDNPTGRIVAADELRRLADTLHRRGGLLLVDEAFADFGPRATSLVPDLPPEAIVLRSFGKAYGLAGLRLGFAVADESTARSLRAALGPWPVSGPAIAIATQALDDAGWLARSRAALEAGCRRLDALLAQAGCAPLGGTALFRLVAHADAQRIAAALGSRGILVRRFEDEPTWLRFGLPGGDSAWQRLEAALLAARETAAEPAGVPG